MNRQIEYAVDVIAGVVYKGSFQWYVTEKEVWFLDRRKWGDAFRSAGHQVPDESEEDDVFKIEVVDEHTVDQFFISLEPYRVDINELRTMVRDRMKTDEEDLAELLPTVLVNFDTRTLASMFPEPGGTFEDFVPEGWVAERVDFLERIPQDQRYWVIDGFDVIAERALPDS